MRPVAILLANTTHLNTQEKETVSHHLRFCVSAPVGSLVSRLPGGVWLARCTHRARRCAHRARSAYCPRFRVPKSRPYSTKNDPQLRASSGPGTTRAEACTARRCPPTWVAGCQGVRRSGRVRNKELVRPFRIDGGKAPFAGRPPGLRRAGVIILG